MQNYWFLSINISKKVNFFKNLIFLFFIIYNLIMKKFKKLNVFLFFLIISISNNILMTSEVLGKTKEEITAQNPEKKASVNDVIIKSICGISAAATGAYSFKELVLDKKGKNNGTNDNQSDEGSSGQALKKASEMETQGDSKQPAFKKEGIMASVEEGVIDGALEDEEEASQSTGAGTSEAPLKKVAVNIQGPEEDYGKIRGDLYESGDEIDNNDHIEDKGESDKAGEGDIQPGAQEGIKKPHDKSIISEKESDVKEIENNAVHLINAVKAKTVFNKMDDTEKESTQFKDRS